MTMSPRIYFRGLNGIRAIAALTVVLIHTGQYLDFFGLRSTEYYKFHWQSYAVTLFFVLSGFLITYLLLEEKSRTDTISLKEFYVRRVLRIWPLYYLVILLTLLLYALFPALEMPRVETAPLALYTFLLANISLFVGTVVTPLTPLWSVGVEEQFYALWPVLIKKSTNTLHVLLAVIAIYLSVKAAFTILGYKTVTSLIGETRVDCMAIGGVGAVILRGRGRLLSLLFSRTTQALCWGIFLYSTLVKPIHIMTSIDHELYSILFMVLILNVSSNDASIVNLERPLFDFLGKISYGLYVFHMLVIFLLRFLLKPLVLPQTWGSYLLVYLAVPATTILVAYLSYRFFELPFLKMKDRFSVVLSQGAGNS